MKICPICAKTYDDSWGICFDCEAELKDIGQKERIEQEIVERGLNSILLCSLCKKEFPSDSLIKVSICWNKGVRQVRGREIKYYCSECYRKQNSLFNRLFNNPTIIPPFMPFLYILALTLLFGIPAIMLIVSLLKKIL